jgi:hypothetical protein
MHELKLFVSLNGFGDLWCSYRQSDDDQSHQKQNGYEDKALLGRLRSWRCRLPGSVEAEFHFGFAACIHC